MRRLRLDRPASPGATLARDVTGPAGEVIARAGRSLNDATVRALVGRGVTWCYVHDRWSEGMALIPLDSGRRTVRPWLRVFERRLADAVAPLVTLSTRRALEVIQRSSPTAALARGRFIENLPGPVSAFMAACATANTTGGLLIDRGAAGDEAGHAIGVAAVTARLVSILGLDAAEQAAIVGAALVHDVGMVFVPPAVRARPRDERTVPERIRYEDHAVLGEAILEPLGTPLHHLAIVAGEHHEAADGSGYPRQRLGGHRVLRTAEELRDVERIMLPAEIVAVADLYERLVSPSPGVVGRSPAAARPILQAAAGASLNREIVLRLLAAFPALPLGTEVRIERGPHKGKLGLVCALPSARGGHARVRLYLDAQGRPLAAPIEVTLLQDRGMLATVADAA